MMFEPTEDMPQMYWQDCYPITKKPYLIIFDDFGNAWTQDYAGDWYACAGTASQDDAISFYENFGWGSKVL
jgi:hypothetical protein